MRLSGKVALVTGASSGIGRAVAHRLHAQGVHVLVHGRAAARVHDVAAQVGGTPLVADLASTDDRARLIAEAQGAFGRVDVLVNNAGIGWAGRFTDMTVEKLREVVTVDLLAHLELSHAFLPAMIERGDGHLSFVTSIAGRTGVAGESVYAAAKAGLDLFAESLRAEAFGTGVGVSVVVPGVVDTGFFDRRGHPYDRRRPRPVEADAVAEAIVRTIGLGGAEAWVPAWLRVAPAVRAVAPAAYRRLAGRFGGPQRLSSEQPGSELP